MRIVAAEEAERRAEEAKRLAALQQEKRREAARRAEIARRFCDLPSFPGGNEELLERVKDALRGSRPDIVEVIVLQGRGWKNIWTGKCDPKVLRRLCK